MSLTPRRRRAAGLELSALGLPRRSETPVRGRGGMQGAAGVTGAPEGLA
jgi:hypothetical protein